MNDLLWYAPLFLHVLKPEQFLKIISALLLEISVVFISDSLPMLSSAAIGMQCFMEPFKWCHTSIPIVPRDLLDLLCSPTPIIAGVLTSYKDEVEWGEV